VWARSALGAIAIVLTGTVLLTQYLSFTALIFLLPVALFGSRARWWLWAIGLVAISNYLLAIQSYASIGGSAIPSYVLDLALTVLVLGLLIELLRTELARYPSPEGSIEAAMSGDERPAPRARDSPSRAGGTASRADA